MVEYWLGAGFDQNVDGFRFKLKSSPPQFQDVQSESPTPGVKCSLISAQVVECLGSIAANTPAQVFVSFNEAVAPGDLSDKLELYAIKDSKEIGPFPVSQATDLGTGK